MSINHYGPMPITLQADDFKCKDEGEAYDGIDALVGCDVEGPDPSVGIFGSSADVYEVYTKDGGDVVELLTQPARERLGEEYLMWVEQQQESAYESYVDSRIKERKEEGV